MSKTPETKKSVADKPAVKSRAVKKPVAQKAAAAQRIRITQIGSSHGQKPGQQATLIGLGLNKLHKSREMDATPETLGRVKKVAHLLRVEELASGQKTHEAE